jgi:hypothetical protein
MRVIQYPHYLYRIANSTESSKDADGNYIEPETTIEFLSICREETDGRGREFKATDGNVIKSTSVIYFPKSDIEIKDGETVLISNQPDTLEENIRIKGTVLKFDKGQLNSRLWL